jgi:hypothetical protein
MDDVIAARALHVLAVVIWIGGVSMATTVTLPAVRRGDLGTDRFQAFQAIEHRFAWQARTAIILVGLTGFYMTWRLDLWDRFRTAAFWWMHAMVCLLAAIRLRPVRRRALHSTPPFSWVGDEAPRRCLRLAASSALAATGAERDHDPGRGRGKPGMVDLLTSHGQGRRASGPDKARIYEPHNEAAVEHCTIF